MASQQRRFSSLPSTEPGAVADGPSVTDALIGVPSRPAPVTAPPPAPRPGEYERPPSRSTARRRVVAEEEEKETLRQSVPADLMTRLRGAVGARRYIDRERLGSLNAALAVAIREFVEAEEARHNDGYRFPWTKGDRL